MIDPSLAMGMLLGLFFFLISQKSFDRANQNILPGKFQFLSSRF